MKSHSFQADVAQILHLVTHSIYSDREIFLRELISNGSDALDTARFEGLKREDLRPVKDNAEPGIRLRIDKENHTITICDDGIGLTEEQAIANLGTIAQSGTRAVANALQEQGEDAKGLIGQFGVGFYSAFMVASKVEVHSLSALPDAKPILWISEGGDGYSLAPGDRCERGTDIVLHLREECHEFLDDDTLKRIVVKHSEFVSWPVMVNDERVNQEQALWTKNPSDVTDDEYESFYRHVATDWRAPLITLHIRADAPIQFNAILFIPENRPFDLDRLDYKMGVKLYQKRIKILDNAEDLLPRCLRFVSGVVDSPDLDLNVSREILQQTPIIQAIKKQITKRLLKKLRDLAKSEPEKYNDFFKQMGNILKEGIHEDEKNREIIVELLRYTTATSGGDLRSLCEVKASMCDDQDSLFYLTDIDEDRAKRRPVLEGFKKRDWEVMMMTDPVDEWVVMHVNEYDGVPLKSAAHGDLPDVSEDTQSADEKQARGAAVPLVEWMKTLLSDDVEDVKISSRLTDSPSVLINKEGSMGANMEHILKAANQTIFENKQILEINAEHPMVKTLAKLNEQGKPGLEPFARLLLDHAMISDGKMADTIGFIGRLQTLMEKAAQQLLTPEVSAGVSGDEPDALANAISLTHGSIGDLKTALATGNHDLYLANMLAQEQQGKARKGAIDAIASRMK